MNPTFEWYQTLIKPFWAPPSWLFGPVWSVLYIFIIISFGWVLWLIIKKKIPAIIGLPFALNLFFNLIFSPIQFGLQNNLLAALDIILVLGTLIWAMIVIFPRVRWVTYINIPYLIWVLFATILQLTVTFLNW
jgi:tryptophan-rich sensory protein